MAYQRPSLVNDEIYHVVSRSVGDTTVFATEENFYRGVFSIYEFNNDNRVNIWERQRERVVEKKKLGLISLTRQNRDMFVEVLAFSFMPNHLHLILRQLKDNGISKFMQKVGTGYANYFNEKYKRQGHLFNKFRAIHIKNDDQLKTVFVYVHTNLISTIEPGWKEKGIKNPNKVIKFLENSKRHSYMDYLGREAFPSVTQRDFFTQAMGGAEGCRAYVDAWVRQKKELKDWVDIVLE